jgi:hypothetical protein
LFHGRPPDARSFQSLMHGCDHSAYSRSQIPQSCHPLFLSCKIWYPRVFYLFTSAIENPEVSDVVLTELCGSAYYPIGSSSLSRRIRYLKISKFLCPSDNNPGSSSTESIGGTNVLVGSSNYPSNCGLNRRLNNWTPNGPDHVSSSWDGDVGIRTTSLATITDRTSNTAIFSEIVSADAF